jgi:hypothetical protein
MQAVGGPKKDWTKAVPAAGIWWSKSRMRWKGLPAKHRFSGPGGGPIQSEVETAREFIVGEIARLAARAKSPGDSGALTDRQAQSRPERSRRIPFVAASIIGRGDRAGPLKNYCVGPLMPGERKSVEPMAAVVAPARVSAKHQSLLHLVGQAAGRMRRFSPKCANSSCRRSRRKGRSRPGLSTTRASRRKAFIRWALRGNIAGGSARPTIARSR